MTTASGSMSGAANPWYYAANEGDEQAMANKVPPTTIARDLNTEHRSLMQAALARDFEHAGSLIEQHLALTTRVLLQQSWPAEAPPDLADHQNTATDSASRHLAVTHDISD